MARVAHYIRQQALLGLLCAQVAAICLHWSRLPSLLLVLAVIIIIWRIQIYRSQWSFPNPVIRTLLVFLSLAAIVTYYRDWYALEPMVTLLVVAFLLKLLEMERQRDGLVLIFVGYFVAASVFLFDQGIVSTFLGIIVLGLLTASLIALNGTDIHYFSRRTTRLMSVLLLQSVPLMLLMLFVFPRIGALWSVPLQSSSGVTGVSDSMSPGNFSQLTQSRKLAFRVSFDKNRLPAPEERYWRGLVFTDFDGRRWQRQEAAHSILSELATRSDHFVPGNQQPVLNYEVILETTNTPWLYTIPHAEIIGKDVIRTGRNELFLEDSITQRIKYRVSSYPHYTVNESVQQLQRSLILPQDYNPRTVATAKQWRSESATETEYIQKVLGFYHHNFTYTLSPPKLGENTVDEFLFNTQQGFCEHFSSSFVVFMRAAGIPARVVAGYQGGEWNETDNYLIVRQYDAHAWAEVWLKDKGWVRIDPTAAVAPNRIDQGLLDSIPETEHELIDGAQLASFQWVNRLLLQWDGVDYRWQRWVLSYDEDVQSQWLEQLLGQVTSMRLALLLVVPGMAILLLYGLLNLKSTSKTRSKKVKLYHCLVKKLQRKKVKTDAGETIKQLFENAVDALPDKKPNLEIIESHFNVWFYVNNSEPDSKEYRDIKSRIRSL